MMWRVRVSRFIMEGRLYKEVLTKSKQGLAYGNIAFTSYIHTGSKNVYVYLLSPSATMICLGD